MGRRREEGGRGNLETPLAYRSRACCCCCGGNGGGGGGGGDDASPPLPFSSLSSSFSP